MSVKSTRRPRARRPSARRPPHLAHRTGPHTPTCPASTRPRRNHGLPAHPGDTTVAQYLTYGLNTVAVHRLRATTWTRYETTIRPCFTGRG
jgi:hypothetical protein